MFNFHSSVSSLFFSLPRPEQQGLLLYTTAESLQANQEDICWVFHKHQWKIAFSSFALLALFNEPWLFSHLLGSWSSVTCSHVPIHWTSIIPNEIPIQSGHNTCKKGKNWQVLTVHSCSLHTFTESMWGKSVTYKPWSWKLSNMLKCICMYNHIS